MDSRIRQVREQPIKPRMEPCMHAAEWAEHARAYYDDGPCDDARAGRICGRRSGEESCALYGQDSPTGDAK